MAPAGFAAAAGELAPVMRLGRVDVDDFIACHIREAARRHNASEWMIAGIVAAESNFNPRALGDNGRSFGLLQLYIDGGQGSPYRDNPEALFDPRLNLDVGVPYIAMAELQARSRGYQGERYIREVARSSGHPGFVALNDPRLTHIFERTVQLITDASGKLVAWPAHNPRICSGAPPPPPPLGSWSEGPEPRTAEEIDGAIHRHLERIGELVDRQ